MGEGPLWSLRDRAIYWVDILGCRLHRRRESDASVQTWEFPEHVSAVFERQSGCSLLLSLRSHLAYFNPATGSLDRVLSVEPGRPGNRLNDGKCDALGRLWIVSHVTSCVFGGEDLRTLYITTARTELSAFQLEQQPLAGGLFACRVKVPGLSPNYFAT